jgi:hypothetical protein
MLLHLYLNGIVHGVRLLMLAHLGHVKYVHVKKVLSLILRYSFPFLLLFIYFSFSYIEASRIKPNINLDETQRKKKHTTYNFNLFVCFIPD